MKNNLKIEISASVILVILTLLLLNPWNLLMQSMVHMTIIALTFITFATLATFILKEKVQDEREIQHRMLSGRVAFLVGATTLIVGILSQSVRGSVDIWLVVTLCVMIFSKFLTRLYSDNNL